MLALLLIAAGCSESDTGIRLDDAWAPPNPEIATTAAFFVSIQNRGAIDETLVNVATDACRITELHMSSLTDGVMNMQQMKAGIEIPPATTVVLEPGGMHIMCIDKKREFSPDQEFELELEFLRADGTSHSASITALVENR